MNKETLPPLPAEMGEWDETLLHRRKFLETSLAAIAGAAVLGVAGVSGKFLVGEALETRPAKWVQVGKVDELAVGKMHRVGYTVQVRDAWRQEAQKGTLYVYRVDETTFTTLNAHCSHLGCVVRWKEEAAHFACPCHSASFRQDGSVESGPPPAPLQRLASKIEEGMLWVEV